MNAMWTLFEVFLVPGTTGDGLLTEETVEETAAQVMSPEQAEAVGFQGLPDRPGYERRLVVCNHSHARRIQHALEASVQVGQFEVHHVDG